MKFPIMLLWKGMSAPVVPLFKRQGAFPSSCPRCPAKGVRKRGLELKLPLKLDILQKLYDLRKEV